LKSRKILIAVDPVNLLRCQHSSPTC